MVDIPSVTVEIRRGKKKKKEKRNTEEERTHRTKI